MSKKTPEEIQNILAQRGMHKVAGMIAVVAERYRDRPLSRMIRDYENGSVSFDAFEAYCYLWRNSVSRLSSELQSFELM